MIKIQLKDYSRFRKHSHVAKQAAAQGGNLAAGAVARETAKWIRDGIKRGQIDMPPLTEVYGARKLREGYRGKTLVRTQDYVRSIQAVRLVAKQRKSSWAVGVPLAFEKLSLTLEFGSKTMVARPHFRPGLRHAKTLAPQAAHAALAGTAATLASGSNRMRQWFAKFFTALGAAIGDR